MSKYMMNDCETILDKVVRTMQDMVDLYSRDESKVVECVDLDENGDVAVSFYDGSEEPELHWPDGGVLQSNMLRVANLLERVTLERLHRSVLSAMDGEHLQVEMFHEYGVEACCRACRHVTVQSASTLITFARGIVICTKSVRPY